MEETKVTENQEKPKFNATDEQLKICRDLSQHLFTCGLTHANVALGDRESVRFDVQVPKKKTIFSIFIYPDGAIEYDRYTTKGINGPEDKLTKEDHLLETKCTDFKGLYSDLVHFSQIRNRL